MITLKEAYEIAKKAKPSINNCHERTNAYIFGCSEDERVGSSPVVVLKDTGEAKNMAWYVANIAEDFVRDIRIEDIK